MVEWPPCMTPCTLPTSVVIRSLCKSCFLVHRLQCFGKMLQAQFLIIDHGFTVGFRSDKSKSCSVVICSTFSWCHLPDLCFWNGTDAHWFSLLNCTGFGTVTNEFCHASCLWSWGRGRRSYRRRYHCGACTISVMHSYTASFPCRYETRLLVVVTCIPLGLWHFLSRVKCMLILWVLPFLLLAASRRHSRSTSALSTADSVGQSGEQALTAWLCFLYVVLFYTILTFAVMCISQHLACASHRCEAFCSVLFNVTFSFEFLLLNVF